MKTQLQHLKRLKPRQQLLRDQPRCVFCGGSRASVTEDHVPPRALFIQRQWPEGFSFGACHSCNQSSSDQDLLIAVLAFIQLQDGPPDLQHERQFKGLLIRAEGRYPGLISSLLGSEEDQRQRAREAFGYDYIVDREGRELTSIRVPPQIHTAVKVTAAKLTRALHFKHTNRIVPLDACIRFAWFSNADLLSAGGPIIPESVVALLSLAGSIERSNVDLKGRFNHRYAVSVDGMTAIYCCAFGTAFAFLTFLSFDATLLENAARALARDTGRERFTRLSWPSDPRRASDVTSGADNQASEPLLDGSESRHSQDE